MTGRWVTRKLMSPGLGYVGPGFPIAQDTASLGGGLGPFRAGFLGICCPSPKKLFVPYLPCFVLHLARKEEPPYELFSPPPTPFPILNQERNPKREEKYIRTTNQEWHISKACQKLHGISAKCHAMEIRWRACVSHASWERLSRAPSTHYVLGAEMRGRGGLEQ